jgi:hypothetical protein
MIQWHTMTARTLLAMAAATLAAVVLSGCADDNPGLDTLRSDPLVTADVGGLSETQVYGQIEFTALGKHQPAMVTRLFKTGTRKVTAADLARAAVQAKADGWELRPAPHSTWTGTKAVDGAPAALRIRRNFSSGDRVLIAVILTAGAGAGTLSSPPPTGS